MASKYWIKLYQEILYDRKMVQLDDHLYRRLIECFLMAGEQNEGGYLPSLDDIAFVLRSTNEMIETDLNELIQRGFLEFKEQRYFVRKFAERQSAMSSTERWQRWRDSQRKDQYEGDTEIKRYSNDSLVDIDKDIDIDLETEEDKETRKKQPFSTLTDAFINASKIPAFGNAQRDVEAGNRMVEAGVDPADVIEAVRILSDKGYNMVGLASVEKAAYNAMSQRKNKGRKDKTSDRARERYKEWGR